MLTIKDWRQLKKLDEELSKGGSWAVLITELSNRVDTIDDLMRLLGALGGQEGAINQSIQETFLSATKEEIDDNRKHSKRANLLRNRLKLASHEVNDIKKMLPDDDLKMLGAVNKLLNTLTPPEDD